MLNVSAWSLLMWSSIASSHFVTVLNWLPIVKSYVTITNEYMYVWIIFKRLNLPAIIQPKTQYLNNYMCGWIMF